MIDSIMALLITILVEFIILYIFIRDTPLKLFIYSILINCFTLPIATFIYINLFSNILIVEIFVILAESVLITLLLHVKYKNALVISIIANTVTALIGLSGILSVLNFI